MIPTRVPRALVVCEKVPHPPVSGGAKRTLRLLEAVERAGATPHVLTAETPTPAQAAEFERRSWTLEAREPGRGPWALRAEQHLAGRPTPSGPYLPRRVAEICSQGEAFAQLEHPHLAHVMDASRAVPWVLSTHNVDSAIESAEMTGQPGHRRRSYQRHRLERAERRAATRAETVLCVSDADAGYYNGRTGSVVVAPNGVDEEFFAVDGELPDNEDILFFGQFTWSPNLEGVRRFLAEGWPRLSKLRPGARLLLAGMGSVELLRDDVEDMPGVVMLGLVDDLIELIARARAIVICIWDGGGTRLKGLESMAAARPIASTSLGIKGVGFVDGRHGLIADEPVRLADALSQLLTDEPLSYRLATAARAHAEQYTWRRALAPAQSVYEELLQRSAPRLAVPVHVSRPAGSAAKAVSPDEQPKQRP